MRIDPKRGVNAAAAAANTQQTNVNDVVDTMLWVGGRTVRRRVRRARRRSGRRKTKGG